MKYLDKIVASFSTDPKATKKKPAPKTVWRIKINGKYVATMSGKTVWKRIGDAKNAVHNHIEAWFGCMCSFGQREYKLDSSHNYLDAMTKSGVLEFVELPIE